MPASSCRTAPTGLDDHCACLGHGAPDLHTLHIGNVAGTRQVQPVGFVQLGADEEVEVGDQLILADQGGREPQLAVCLDNADDLRRDPPPLQLWSRGVVLGWTVQRSTDSDTGWCDRQESLSPCGTSAPAPHAPHPTAAGPTPAQLWPPSPIQPQAAGMQVLY